MFVNMGVSLRINLFSTMRRFSYLFRLLFDDFIIALETYVGIRAVKTMAINLQTSVEFS